MNRDMMTFTYFCSKILCSISNMPTHMIYKIRFVSTSDIQNTEFLFDVF